MESKNLNTVKTAHFIGIKGVGMTALAQILKNKGVSVFGSDVEEEFFTDKVLEQLGIPFVEKFSKNNIPADTDLVICSQAYINKDNEEVVEAKKRGLKVITYPQALAKLFNSAYGIAVAGSHGKSTTTAMLGVILEEAGLDPTVIVGSRVNQWNSNARVGNSKYFVIEADEYRDAFLQYKPKIAVVTNIDFDHPDYFKDKKQYAQSFKKFTSQPSVQKVITKTVSSGVLKLKIPGEYNQKNALLAHNVALGLGVKPKVIKKALENFEGLARRFEYVGQCNGAKMYDDYAHHPTEINAVVEATKQQYPDKKVLVLFQPHTYSRTENLFDDFVKSLKLVNEVYILKTYASARENGADTSGNNLAKLLNAKYFKNHKEAELFLKEKLNKHKVLLALGAGDQWQILKNIAALD